MITEEQIIEILKSYSTYTDRSRTDECVHESNFDLIAKDLIAKDLVKKLTIADVIVSDFCECDGVQDLHAMTGECRKCGKECDY